MGIVTPRCEIEKAETKLPLIAPLVRIIGVSAGMGVGRDVDRGRYHMGAEGTPVDRII